MSHISENFAVDSWELLRTGSNTLVLPDAQVPTSWQPLSRVMPRLVIPRIPCHCLHSGVLHQGAQYRPREPALRSMLCPLECLASPGAAFWGGFSAVLSLRLFLSAPESPLPANMLPCSKHIHVPSPALFLCLTLRLIGFA